MGDHILSLASWEIDPMTHSASGCQRNVAEQHREGRHDLRQQRGRDPVHLPYLCHHVRGEELNYNGYII